MSSDPLTQHIAAELSESAFPLGFPTTDDSESWREAIYADAEVAAAAARNFLADVIRDHAKSQHRHVDVGGGCPMYRSSPDRCDITAALMNVADIVGRPF